MIPTGSQHYDGVMSGGHYARSGAVDSQWAVSQQPPDPTSPAARLGWMGTSASAGGYPPLLLCSPSSPSPMVSPIPTERAGDGL